jgi:glycosyltransferase involved in cell wall biosynthesis
MPSRAGLLFLSQCLPYPPDSGIKIRAFHMLQQLRKDFDVTVIMFSRRNHQPDAASRASGWCALRDLGLEAFEPLPIGAEDSRIRNGWDHLRSVVTRRAYTYYQYRSGALLRQLREVRSRRGIRLVHLDSIDLHGAAGELPAAPVVCTHPDIESHVLRRRADRASSAPLRWYIRHQAALVERTERGRCPTFAANLVVSEVDADRLRGIAPTARVVVAPNGVDTTYFTPPASRSAPTGRVTFVGPSFFEPNRDAIDFFLRDVWPQVRVRHRSASFHVIGRVSADDRARFARHDGVTVHDHVPDVRPHLAEADCVVVPIRVGGGTRLKVLDAWAMGRAIVSTAVGCEGLRAVDGENILVRDTPAAFADAVAELLANPALRARLGENGRRTVEAHYSWESIGSEVRELYRRLV